MFSCEFCEIFKITFFIEHFWWSLLRDELTKEDTLGMVSFDFNPAQMKAPSISKHDREPPWSDPY